MILNPTNATLIDLPTNKQMKEAAEKIEGQFLVEMFKSAGVGEPLRGFDGGVGEAQFSSFLVDEYAQATVKSGGIGLAEVIYSSLVREG